MAIPFYNHEEEEEQEALPPPVQEEEEESCSFLEQLIKELVGVFCAKFGSGGSVGGPVRDSLSDRRRNSAGGSRFAPPTNQPLPDLVCCHVQAFSPPILLEEDELLDVSPRVPRPTTSEPDTGLSLDIKMTIDFAYQRIGRDLRHIADQYENHHHRRRRHPAGSHTPSTPHPPSSTNIKFEFALKLVIPVTLLASLAFLRRL